jgi:hypothetical protein
MSTLRGASGDQKGWSRQFDDPIPTGDGELRSLRDAGVYILALPPAEAEREHWQRNPPHPAGFFVPAVETMGEQNFLTDFSG